MTSSVLLTLAIAFALLLLCGLGAVLFHLGENLLRRWRQGRAHRDRWMRLLK